MARWRDEIGERRLKEGRGLGLRATAAGLLAFYLLAALLNGDALHRNADIMPYGRGRDLALRLTAPLQAACLATRAHLLRNWIEQHWNKDPS